jgi:nitroreductase
MRKSGEDLRYVHLKGKPDVVGKLLEAHALGLGTGWIGCCDAPQEEPAKRILKIPDEQVLQAIITVGHSAEVPVRERKDIKGLTFYNEYGNR